MARIEAWRDAAATRAACGRTPVASVTLAVSGLSLLAALFGAIALQGGRRASRSCSACWRCWPWPASSWCSACCRAFCASASARPRRISVKTVADGFDDWPADRQPHRRRRLYRNRALQRLAGTRSGRHATLEELFAGEPQSAEAFYRLNRAADRGEAREEEFYVRSSAVGRPGGRWLRVSVRPSARHRAAGEPGWPLTLWQVRDVTRERTREIETVGSLRSTLPSTTTCRRACSPSPPTAASLHVNTTLAQWLGLRPEIGAGADAGGHRVVRRRGADPCRRPRRPRDAARPRSAARGRPRLPRAPGLPRPRHARRAVDSGSRPQRERRRRRRGRPRGATRPAVQAAPFGIATVDADGRILDANTAFVRMFSRDGRTRPRRRRPGRRLPTSARARSSRKALQRAYSGRTGATPWSCSSAPSGEFARRIYVSPARNRQQGARGRHPLRHRRHRAEGAGAEVRPQPQDGGRGPAGGRRRARLQQRAHRHHRLLRSAAADAPADRSGLSRHHEHQEQRQPRRRPGAPAARLLAPADAAGGGAGAGRAADRSLRAPQQGAGREGRRSRSCPAATCGTSRPTRPSSSTSSSTWPSTPGTPCPTAAASPSAPATYPSARA